MMILPIRLLLALSFTSASNAYDYLADHNATRKISVPVDGEKHFRTVKELSEKVKTVEELLKLLPKELKTNYVFMFESHSLQEASYQNPRAILFSDQADFVMTFNGSPSQQGFETIETLRFVEDNNNPRFILEEIVMKGDEARRLKYLIDSDKNNEIKFVTDRSDRVGQNPSLCLSCHRQDPRPNWDHYPFWPGAYGQYDSRPYSKYAWGRSSSTGDLLSAESYNLQAAQQFPLFLTTAKIHERYRHLEGINEYGELSPDLISTAEGMIPSKRTSEYRTKKRPLFHLTDKFAVLNSRRIARLIRDSSSPRSNALKLFEIVNLCGNPFLLESTKYYDAGKVLYANSEIAWEDFFMNFLPSPYNGFENSNNRADLFMNSTLLEWFPETFSKYIRPDGFAKQCLDFTFEELAELE